MVFLLTELGLSMRTESVVREDLVIPDLCGGAVDMFPDCHLCHECKSGQRDRKSNNEDLITTEASADFITGSHSAHGLKCRRVQWKGVVSLKQEQKPLC